MEASLRWRPTPLALALATCSASAFTVAIVAGAWQAVLLAAPFLGALASQGWRAAPPACVRAEATPPLSRVFENEATPVRCDVSAEGGSAELAVAPVPGPGLELSGGTGLGVDAVTTQCEATVRRWGNYQLRFRVEAVAPGALLAASAQLPVAYIRGYPLVSPSQTALPRTSLPDRLGTHLTRRHGTGVEYADTRVYIPGDQLHMINWQVSARLGQLHVTERFTDRAADILAVIDTYPHAFGPASDSLERAARGATQLALSALQRGDRTGVIALGGKARWLSPDLGRRQFYRIMDTVLDVGEDHRPIAGTLAPRAALPPGAIVIAFSPMLEPAFALALMDLHHRGHPVVLVDVLAGRTPFTDNIDSVTHSIWRIERRNQYRNLGVLGIDVVEWDESNTLEQCFRLLAARAPRSRTRR
jgi:uncharacterized protein (DUF58 family)